eukprot:2562706-Lingulodinium_polyedra.AAC.1
MLAMVSDVERSWQRSCQQGRHHKRDPSQDVETDSPDLNAASPESGEKKTKRTLAGYETAYWAR